MICMKSNNTFLITRFNILKSFYFEAVNKCMQMLLDRAFKAELSNLSVILTLLMFTAKH